MEETQQTQQPVIKKEDNGSVLGSMTIVELTSLVNRYSSDIEKLREDMKMQSSMFRDAFENDAKYHETSQKVKEATKLRNAEKQRIMKQPAVETLTAKMNELKNDIKDAQESLSGYLEEYQRVSGTNIIETEDGEIREIIPQYKLVKRKT